MRIKGPFKRRRRYEGATFTRHALNAFHQRFPGKVIDDEWNSAMRRKGQATRQQLVQIRRQCPLHRHLARKTFMGVYYRVSVNGVVFVVAPPLTIVTVFGLGNLMEHENGNNN